MAILVPIALLAIAVLIWGGSYVVSQRRQRRTRAHAVPEPPPRILIHSINDDRCTGCDACVVVCPTDVLELVTNKSRVVRFGDCIQCVQCMWACPTQALVMHWEDEEPPPVKVPELDPYYQSAVPGQYLIGEVSGKPLVKNAANIGRAVVEHMIREGRLEAGAAGRRAEGSDAREIEVVDVAIVGSGPGGLSAALTCQHYGLSYILLEKDQILNSTVARWPKGKELMAEPHGIRNVSFLPCYDTTKAEILQVWDELFRTTGLRVKLGEAVELVQKRGDGLFDVRTNVSAYRAQRVVLATGTRGKPRTLGVPGENLSKVHGLLDDPDRHRGKHALVVGGGDSAVEAACALADSGARVTVSYRGRSFSRCSPRNKQNISEYAKKGKITVLFGSNVTRFEEQAAIVKLDDGTEKRLKNDVAFVLIGADPPVKWLEKLGIHYVERPHWYALGDTDQLVESLTGAQNETPRDARSCAALVLSRGEVRPLTVEQRIPVPEPTVIRRMPDLPAERPMTVPGAALDFGEGIDVFTSAAKPGQLLEPSRDRPMSLEEFAKLSQKKRTRKKKGEELTRLLRSLRDEGARLAHEDPDATGAGGGQDVHWLDPLTSVSAVSRRSSVSFGTARATTDFTPGFHGTPTVIVDAGMAPPSAPPQYGHRVTPPPVHQRLREPTARPPSFGNEFADAMTRVGSPDEVIALREQAYHGGNQTPDLFFEDETRMGNPGELDDLRAATLPSAPPDHTEPRYVLDIHSDDLEEVDEDDRGAGTQIASPEALARLRNRSRRG